MKYFRIILSFFLFVAFFFSVSLVRADDAPDYLTGWGTSGTGNGQFDTPRWIRVDSSDNVYVFDYGNSRIQKFDSSGNFLTKWGSLGTGSGQFTNPLGFVIDSADNVYVLDRGRIQKFDSSGTHLATWTNYFTDPSVTPTPTPTPTPVCVENWCLDPEDLACVPVFCDIPPVDDIPVDELPPAGSPAPGATGIGIDSNDIIYLTYVRYGAYGLYGTESSVYKINTSGILISNTVLAQGSGAFAWTPVEIAIDPSGNMHTLNYSGSLPGSPYVCGIRKFSSSGAYVGDNGSCPESMDGIGGSGPGMVYPTPGSFFGVFGAPPSGIYIKGNSLFVTHSANYQVVKFNHTNSNFTNVSGFAYWGDYIWTDPSVTIGKFDSPFGVAVDSNDNVYVTDSNLNSVQKFGTAILDHSVNYSVISSQVGWAGSIFGNASQSVANGGTAMQVRAQPVRGYAFLRWSDGSTENPRQDTNVQADISVQAEFIFSFAITEPTYGMMSRVVEQGLVTSREADPTKTSEATFNVSFEFVSKNAKVTVPPETVVTDSRGSIFDLNSFTITDEVTDIRSQQPNAVGAVKFGITDHKLNFSLPVTIDIPVDPQFNGQTLPVTYRFEGESDWHSETNCRIVDGKCTFSTNHATSFAVLKIDSTPICSNVTPLKVPNLFQIDVNGTSAKMYFSPDNDGDRYVVSYSTRTDAEEHSVIAFLAKEGVQNFTINYLKPNTTYYFKVRAQNDCIPGNWSNILSAKTKSIKMSGVFSYYKFAKDKIIKVIKKTVITSEKPADIITTPTPEITKMAEVRTSASEVQKEVKTQSVESKKRCYLFNRWLCL